MLGWDKLELKGVEVTYIKQEAIQVKIDRVPGGWEAGISEKQYKKFMKMSRFQRLHNSIRWRNRRGWQIIQMTVSSLIFLGTYKFSGRFCEPSLLTWLIMLRSHSTEQMRCTDHPQTPCPVPITNDAGNNWLWSPSPRTVTGHLVALFRQTEISLSSL